MPELIYSNDAFNVKKNFYRVDAIVYVEGTDDLMFWHEIFNRVPDFKIELEPLGCSDAIDGMIKKIEGGQVEAIAARDSDYLKLKGEVSSSPRVLYTHGYSIENSLISEDSVLSAAQMFCRNPKITIDVVQDWIWQLETNIYELMVLDLATSLSKNPFLVIGDNSSRFTVSRKSYVICKNKCGNAATAAVQMIPRRKRTQARKLLKSISLILILRGHFLLSNLQKFLSTLCSANGKNVSIPYDSLYSFLILFFSKKLDNAASLEFSYVEGARVAAATFNL